MIIKLPKNPINKKITKAILKSTCIFSFLFLSFFTASGQQKYKQIQILGLKIYTEQSLIKDARLEDIAANKNHFKSIADKIERFYIKNGYVLIKVYLIQETDDELIIFVDEGRIMRIIFKRLSTIDIIKMKYEFDLKRKIYNKHTVDKEISRIKKKYKFKDIDVRLKQSEEGDKAFFQLDDEINIPVLGKARLPFFAEYSPRYNLEIEFIRESRIRSKGLYYGFKTSYSKGLIPNAEYYHPGILKENDLLSVKASMGWIYGLDLKFTDPPKWTFMELQTNYFFAPLLKDYFTPMASMSAYHSRSSRNDIGLSSYNYLILKGILAPGVTLLNKLRIYTGLGGEKVFIFTPEIDEDSEYTADIKERTDTWAVFESRFNLDMKPWTLKNTRKQQFETIFNYYVNEDYFFSLTVDVEGDFEFDNLDFYCFTLEYSKIWSKPPFYHEYSIPDANFKGFMGKSYHTRNMIKSANEYKLSIYRDSIHIGIFTDLVRFEGSGYDLFGYQHGIVAGTACHIIFLDQFEFNIFFGKDYLFSAKESQYNIYMNAKKKW